MGTPIGHRPLRAGDPAPAVDGLKRDHMTDDGELGPWSREEPESGGTRMTSAGGAGPLGRMAAVVRVSAVRAVPRLGSLRRWLPQAGGDGAGGGGGRVPTREQQERTLREWAVLRDRLHGVAQERVAQVGDLLREAGGDFTPGSAEAAVRRDHLWALDAYQAAGKLLDEALDLPDLAAAVVLADRAAERFVAAVVRHEGHRPHAPVVRCFYNPLHGAAEPAAGRGRGTKGRRAGGASGSRRLSPREAAADRRPACHACRLAILADQLPDVLPALVPVKISRRHTVRVLVPYFAVPQSASLWSANGCGAYGDDAPALVLRGEHHRRAEGR